MKHKCAFFGLAFILFILLLHTNTIYCDANNLAKIKDLGINIAVYPINQYNAKGNKQGVWIEDNDVYIKVSNFNNGLKVGCEFIYDSHKTPAHIYYAFTYKDNIIQSAIIYDDNGQMIAVLGEFKDINNFDNFHIDYQLRKIFSYISYSQEFDNNGKIQAEGYLLLGKDWEIDAERIGDWKLYAPDGSFIIKNYSLP